MNGITILNRYFSKILKHSIQNFSTWMLVHQITIQVNMSVLWLMFTKRLSENLFMYLSILVNTYYTLICVVSKMLLTVYTKKEQWIFLPPEIYTFLPWISYCFAFSNVKITEFRAHDVSMWFLSFVVHYQNCKMSGHTIPYDKVDFFI